MVSAGLWSKAVFEPFSSAGHVVAFVKHSLIRVLSPGVIAAALARGSQRGRLKRSSTRRYDTIPEYKSVRTGLYRVRTTVHDSMMQPEAARGRGGPALTRAHPGRDTTRKSCGLDTRAEGLCSLAHSGLGHHGGVLLHVRYAPGEWPGPPVSLPAGARA